MEVSLFPRLFVLDFLSNEEKALLKVAEEPAGKPTSEEVHLCPLMATVAAEDAAAVENDEVIFTS